MDITIFPRTLQGSLRIIPSKSQAHRYLICAALGSKECTILCPETNQDIDATADCLQALGAEIFRSPEGFQVTPIRNKPAKAMLNCQESGSTLRFLLPLAGALGIETTFKMEGRLPNRPLSPLWEEMERMGCSLSRPTDETILCTGKLRSGQYFIDGSVSSQYITGLLFATSVLGNSNLTVTGEIESKPYIDMTKKAMALFSQIPTPDTVTVEGDWSNGAFWLAANQLGSHIHIDGLEPNSPQGDRTAGTLIPALTTHQIISAKDIPDLVPILSVVAAIHQGATFTDIRRLRLKESDRVASTIAMLEALGGKAAATEDTLTIFPARFHGGIVDACNDHRIAMAAAIAATAAAEPVTILGAHCVKKSYPGFWDEYSKLGGSYEQHLR